jgi:6-phosphogluconolactonase
MLRRFLTAVVLLSVVACSYGDEEKPMIAYFGTYTGGKSEGIYFATFDSATGKLGEPHLAAKSIQPSFLAMHPSGKFLYSVNETAEFGGEKAGAITAFAIEDDHSLRELNQKTSSGAAPCHLVVDRSGRFVLAANYTGGNVCVYEIKEGGELGEQTALVQHEASDAAGQKRPHAHSINVDANNRFAFAADLGLDKVLIYKFDDQKGTLAPNDPPAGLVPKGGGPRHFDFHPSGKFAYTNNETLSSVTAFAYDAERGALKELQTISTLPHEVQGNSTAEIRVHPSGKFLYTSNRGHNSIAIFQVDEATGKLTAAGHQGKDVNIPRNFNVDPTGKWLVVCNQASDSVIVFKINAENGSLEPTDVKIEVGAPVCVKFLER